MDDKDRLLSQGGEEMAIVSGAMNRVDQLKDKAGSYYGAVPEKYRNRIDGLVDDHFEFYKNEFSGDRNKFREAMSRYWLVKKEAFDDLAKATGMRQVSSSDEVGNPNSTRFAILTASGSYLLVDEKAFSRDESGAAMNYVRLPLREGAKVNNMRRDSGTFFIESPQVGERVRLEVSGLPDILRTSSAISMYVSEQNMPRLEVKDVNRTLLSIDSLTLVP